MNEMTSKTVSKKTTTANEPKSVLKMLEESAPIRVVNRTFLASLGLVSTVQTELGKAQVEFGKTFERLVKDGEKTRDKLKKSFINVRKDVATEVDVVVDEVVEDVVEAKERVVERVRAA
jgi:hypothetical protein